MENRRYKNMALLITYTLVLAFVLFKFEKVAFVFNFLISVIYPFILGACIAFVVSVPLGFIEKKLFGRAKSKVAKKLKRPISIILTLIAIVSVIGVALFVVVPELSDTIAKLIESCVAFPQKALAFLDKYEIDMPMVKEYLQNVNIDWESVIENVLAFAKNGLGNVFSSTFGIISSIISGTFSGVIAFVFSIYVLAQKERLAMQFKRVVYAFLPEAKATYVVKVFALAHTTFANFITGQCVEAVILGTMFFVTLTLLGFNYALLIGVMIAVFALVPIFGAFVGCGIGTFMLLMVDPMQALWFLVIFQVLQQIEGNLIYPYVVGGSVGLPSIWVLVAVTVGGNLFGVAGMLCFIPLLSVMYALFKEKVESIEKKKGIKIPMAVSEVQPEANAKKEKVQKAPKQVKNKKKNKK